MVENAVVSLEEIEMTTKEALVNHGASSKISTLVAQAVRSLSHITFVNDVMCC